MKAFADRISHIDSFIVMNILERALELERLGKKIVHFEIGEPDFKTPQRIVDAAINGCQTGKTHYTHSQGILEFREAISQYKKNTRQINVDPRSEIMITSGTSPAFFMACGSLLNPGDEVIVSNPGYSCYPNFISFFGGKTVSVDVIEQERFDFNPERIEKAISPKTKAIILNSPSNPTGQILPEKTLNEIANIAIAHDLYVISDEIYSELTYNGKRAPSIMSIPEMKERTIVLDGFSKFWAMTGWRLGYMIAPPQIMHQMNKINQNFCICAPSISQEAGMTALKCIQETQLMLDQHTQRRNYLHKRVMQIEGLSMIPPAGAFYGFVNIKKISNNSLEFAMNLLEKANVAATPGIGFGSNGEGYIRISYCTDINNIEEGMNRIEEYLRINRK